MEDAYMNALSKRYLAALICLIVFVSTAHAHKNSESRAFSIVRGSGYWAVTGLLWSPNGKQLASSVVRSSEKFDFDRDTYQLYGDYSVQIWNTSRLRPQAVLRSPAYLPSRIPVDQNQMTFSPDSALFALDLNMKGVGEGVPIWRARDGKLIKVLHASGEPLAFSSNRRIIAAYNDIIAIGGDSFGLEYRDVRTGRVQHRIEVHLPRNRLSSYYRQSSGGGGLPQCLVSPNSHRAALMLWKYTKHSNHITGSSGAETLLFDPHTGKRGQILHVGPKENFEPVAFSGDGRNLGMIEFWKDTASRAKVFDCQSGRLLSTLEAPAKDSVVALALSANGRTVALATSRGVVQPRESAGGKLIRTLQKGPQAVTALAFSPDDQTLAVGEVGGAVRLWPVFRR